MTQLPTGSLRSGGHIPEVQLPRPELPGPSGTVNSRDDLDGRRPTLVLLAPGMQIVSVDAAVSDAVLPTAYP